VRDTAGGERKLSIVPTTVTFIDQSTNPKYGGHIFRQAPSLSIGEPWSVIESGAGSVVGASTLSSARFDAVNKDAYPGNWIYLYRPFMRLDTSSLPDTAVVVSAKIRLKGKYKYDGGVGNVPSMNISEFNPLDKAAIVEGDFQNFGTALFSTSISYGDWLLEDWNEFPLNEAGLSVISKTGLTVFGTREVAYDLGGATPTWKKALSTGFAYYGPVRGVEANMPRLEITYIIGAPRSRGFISD